MFHTIDGKEYLEFKNFLGTTHYIYIYAWEGWEEGWKIWNSHGFQGERKGDQSPPTAYEGGLLARGYQFTANEGKGKGNSNFKEP